MNGRDSLLVNMNGASIKYITAFVAQLGERKTEDLKVRGSIPRGGIFLFHQLFAVLIVLSN